MIYSLTKLGQERIGRIETGEEGHRRKQSEHNQMREDYERSKGLKTCEFLLRSVFEFGMDHIKNLKVKELRMLLHYHFRSEKLKSSPNKVELVEAVTDFL